MSIYLKSIILGAVQGLTEFLPVSSSGHLVIVGHLLRFESPGALFEVFLHLGTILSVIYFYRSYLFSIKYSEIKLFVYASIPAALIGFFLKSPIESLFDSTKLVGIAFLATAYMNLQLDKNLGKKSSVDSWESWAMGIAQACALIPGISRSGSTILAGKVMKLSSQTATRFSLIMSIPVILGANFLEVYTHGFNKDNDIFIYILGFVVAFTTGLAAINVLISMLETKKMKYFAYYLILVGLFSIFFV